MIFKPNSGVSSRLTAMALRCRNRATGTAQNHLWVETLAHLQPPSEKFNEFNGLHTAKMVSSFSICGPAHVIEAECFAGLVWYHATSRDGVAVTIARRWQYASGRREPETELTVSGRQ